MYDDAGKDKFGKITLDQLAQAFEKASAKQTGWRKKYLSIDDVMAEIKNVDNSKKLSLKDVVRGFIEKSTQLYGEDHQIDAQQMQTTVKKIEEKYGKEVRFTNPNVNSRMQLEVPTPWEDESIFDNMTAWEIYECGTENADVANNIINTVSWVSVMENRGYNGSVIRSLINEANKEIEKMVQNRNFMSEAVKKLRKSGFNIPESFENVASRYLKFEYARTERWKWGR